MYMKLKLAREIINITTKPILAAVSDYFKRILESLLAIGGLFHPLISSALATKSY